jgi:hypothetical protein
VEPVRPSRLPSILLISVTCLVGICGVPSSLFFGALAVHALARGVDTVPIQILTFAVAGLLAYPIAIWLWFRARRARSTARAWLAAALGLILVLGSAAFPVTIIGKAMAEEWRETQPGGRGYVPPAGTR